MERDEFFKEIFRWTLDTKLARALETLADEKERPPGAIPEPLFSSLCTGCDACMIACPKNIILIDDLEKRLPFLEDKTPCIGCAAPCRASCPTGALQK